MKHDPALTFWLRMGLLMLPSAVLTALLALELRFGATNHFFLHTLTGWDIALIGLLAATYFGRRWSRWDGLALLMLALWAQMPDVLYIQGYYHRDWMDVFLFHIALDEIITLALPALAALWAVLMVCYARFRLGAFGAVGSVFN
jgi:hypothetical protein